MLFRIRHTLVSALFVTIMVLSIINTSQASDFGMIPQDDPIVRLERNYWPTDGWRNATPEEVGLDLAKLDEMLEYIEEESWQFDSVLIVRNGYVVLEEYPRRFYDVDDRHAIHSCTKSFASALIGIAIAQGYIDDVNLTLAELFPSRTIDNMDEQKEKVTLDHLLTMTSGIEWDEWSYPYGSARNDFTILSNQQDHVQFVLDRPIAYEPGDHWTYNSGGSHLLGAIVADHSGEDPLDFAREYLFDPLGIEYYDDFIWWRDPLRYLYTGGGLHMTPRAMAKFGYLYLNNGTWDGEQILPNDWVAQSALTHYSFSSMAGYGYQWWTYPTDDAYIYAAVGFEGQYIFVIPEFDMVVVFTASLPNYEPMPTLSMLFHFILDSIIDDGSSSDQSIDLFTVSVIVSLIAPVVILGAQYPLFSRKMVSTKEGQH